MDSTIRAAFHGGIEYARRREGPVRLDVLAPADGGVGRPLVVYFHGGGWHEGDRGAGMHPWLNPLLVGAGLVCASVTYRLSGTASWPAPLSDARDAVEWLADNADSFGADASRLGVYGFSAGAHLAALVALQPDTRVRAAALAAVPADLRDVDPALPSEVTALFESPPTRDQLAELSPICSVGGAVPPPMLLAHGTDDQVVAYQQGVAFRDALRGAGGDVEWHGIEGGTHEWADRPEAGLDETRSGFGGLVRDFFLRTLTG